MELQIVIYGIERDFKGKLKFLIGHQADLKMRPFF